MSFCGLTHLKIFFLQIQGEWWMVSGEWDFFCAENSVLHDEMSNEWWVMSLGAARIWKFSFSRAFQGEWSVVSGEWIFFRPGGKGLTGKFFLSDGVRKFCGCLEYYII